MPFGGEFDLAVCFGAIGHFLPKDQPRFIERIHQVLKPGGRFVFVTSTVLSIWSQSYWLCRGFNAAMHVRNLLVKPPFIMYYLTFSLAEAVQKSEAYRFFVEVSYPYAEAKLKRLAMVVARKVNISRRRWRSSAKTAAIVSAVSRAGRCSQPRNVGDDRLAQCGWLGVARLQ